MRHHVYDATRRLKPWQRICKFRIHDREPRTKQIRISYRYFLMSLFVGYYGISASLTASCRNGQHHSYGERGKRLCLSVIKIPEIFRSHSPQSNSFGGIDRRTATNRKKKIDAFLNSLGNSCINALGSRIWGNTAELTKLYFFGTHGILDLIQQTVFSNSRAAIHYHYFLSAITFQSLTDFFLCVATKYKLRRGAKCEIIHIIFDLHANIHNY